MNSSTGHSGRIHADDLRETVVTMISVLLTVASVGYIASRYHLHPVHVVRAVILSLILSRNPRTRTLEYGLTFAVFPAAALFVASIDCLMLHQVIPGSALFVLIASLAVWIRRFGVKGKHVSRLVSIALISLLLLGASEPISGSENILWAGVVAVIVSFWATVIQWMANKAGFIRRDNRPLPILQTPGKQRAGYLPSTRMSIQLGVALCGAFIVGHIVFSNHWAWVVLTTFIVCIGARSRGDVLHKGVLRALGAGFGTIGATLLARVFPMHGLSAIALIFSILTIATLLRPLNYAYWAGGMTAALSILYALSGRNAAAVLQVRVEGIAVGALVGSAACWFVLPIRTRDVVRKRLADTLAVLSDLLVADWKDEATLQYHEVRFHHGVDLLEQVAPSIHAHRGMIRIFRRHSHHPANAINALRTCVQPVSCLLRCARETRTLKSIPEVKLAVGGLCQKIGSARRAIAMRKDQHSQRVPALSVASDTEYSTSIAVKSANECRAAFQTIHRAMGCIETLYWTLSLDEAKRD